MTGSTSFFIALLAWASTVGIPFEGLEPITPGLAIERAAECGLEDATTRYDDVLESDILSVSHAVSVTEAQLICLDSAIGFGILVELPSNVQPRFDAIRQARALEISRSKAREWLAQRGLLERVPKYVAGTSDDPAFMREVEQLCGVQTRGAIQSRNGRHVLNSKWIKKRGSPPKAGELEAFSCLLNVTTVAGIKVGFIGNEAYQR